MSFFDSDFDKHGYLSTVPLTEVPEDFFADRRASVMIEAILQDQSVSDALIRDLLQPPSVDMVGVYNYYQDRRYVNSQFIGSTMVPYRHWSDSNISTTSRDQWKFYWESVEGVPISLDMLESNFLSSVLYVPIVYAQKVYGWNTYDDECTNSPFAAKGATKYVGNSQTPTASHFIFKFTDGNTEWTKQVPFLTVMKVVGRADTSDGTAQGNYSSAWIGYYTIPSAPTRGRIYFSEYLDDGRAPDEADLTIPENERTPLAAVFLPSIPLRLENTPGHKYQDNEIYKLNRDYAIKLGLDYDSLSEQVNEGVEKDQVQDDVFVRVGVDITNPAPPAVHYTMEFFKWFATEESPISTRAAFEALFSGTIYNDVKSTIQFINTMAMTDTLELEDLFNIYVNYIEQKIVTGSIGAVGATEHEMHINQGKRENNYIKFSKDYLILRRQISATQYEEIEVGGPLFSTGVRSADKYNNYVINDLTGATKEGSNNFILPVGLYMYQQMPTEQKKYFAFYAVHMAVEGYVYVETKWYQKTEFVFFIQFVALAAAMVSAGQSVEAFLLLVETYGLVGAVVISVVISKAIGYVVTEVIALLADAFGAEFAAIFAAIAAVVLAAYGQFGENLMLPADTLVHITNGLLQGATTVNQEAFKKLQKENEQRQLEAERLQQELDAALEDLQTGIDLDPAVLGRIDPLFVPGETPDQYFARVAHNANPGVLGIDALHNYVNMALTLPKTPKLDTNDLWGI